MASPPANDKASMPTTMSRLEIDTITIFMSPGWAADPFVRPPLVESIRAASSLDDAPFDRAQHQGAGASRRVPTCHR
jgi:hypothetical protein